MQTEEGRWRVEFDEPWARDGAKPPESDDSAAAASAGGEGATQQQPQAA
jgi:DNA topoisomerase-3